MGMHEIIGQIKKLMQGTDGKLQLLKNGFL
jgi:hypothetical protein